MQRKSCYLSSPIGILKLEADENGICSLEICRDENVEVTEKPVCPILKKAKEELAEYFSGKRKVFTVPVSIHGTDFQMKVWESLKKIPYGETRCYGEIANDIGNSKAARAVGMANNRNPVMIIVPCHRVIGKDGSMVGFGGGLAAKEYLLRLESAAKVVKGNGQVDISGVDKPD